MALVKKEHKDMDEAGEVMETEPLSEEREGGSCGESAISQEYDRSQLPELLKIYYRWLFPYDKYFDWLQYGDPDTFSHREFSFTLADDVYVRYQSFDNREALEEGVRKATPYKIDIGAIFSVKPSMKNRVQQANFQARRKELVFDIDMTDYDDIRTCCQEANICTKCWRFITIAIKVIDRALREDFGFKHLLWVYSGRRGVHCWVCDQEAIGLSQEARSAIVEYLTLVKGGEQQAQKVKLRTPLHPSIKSSLAIIRRHFHQLLEEQDFLETRAQWSKMLALVPKRVAAELDQEWQETPATSVSRWGRLEQELKLQEVNLHEIMLQWSYPRLDVNVSKGINHLLKSPLCVHPKTGRICVPINPRKLDEFDPFKVPIISQICHELDRIKTELGESKHKLVYMKTSLKPYMEDFKQFLIPLIKENNKRKAKEEPLSF